MQITRSTDGAGYLQEIWRNASLVDSIKRSPAYVEMSTVASIDTAPEAVSGRVTNRDAVFHRAVFVGSSCCFSLRLFFQSSCRRQSPRALCSRRELQEEPEGVAVVKEAIVVVSELEWVGLSLSSVDRRRFLGNSGFST